MKFNYRLLSATDEHLVKNFLIDQVSKLPSEYFMPVNDVQLVASLSSERGMSFGAFYSDSLIGLRLSYALDDANVDLTVQLDENFIDLKRVLRFCGTLIDPTFQAKGVGDQLIKMNCKLALDRGFERVIVTVHPDNLNSRKLLERNQFTVIKEIFLFNRYRRLLLQRTLS